MRLVPIRSATETWRDLLGVIIDFGAPAAPTSAGSQWKERSTLELLGLQSVWKMEQPAILCGHRKLGRKFMAAEAAWVLSGDNRVGSIKKYGKVVERFSDDGHTFEGAYGPPFVDQVSYIVRALARDVATRQAVATIWRPRVVDSKDPPCTLSLQWIIRGGKLNCVATMRSSDAWTGVPYDVFTFSMMSAYVSLLLWRHANTHGGRGGETTDDNAPLPLGRLVLTTGSGHLYLKEKKQALVCRAMVDAPEEPAPLDLTEFDGPDELIAHLWELANYAPGQAFSKKWMGELFA